MSDSPTAIWARQLGSSKPLSEREQAALLAVPFRLRHLVSEEEVISDGDEPRECCVVVTGMLHRHKSLPDGKRQILSFHVPGEMPDLMGLFLDRMDHALAATCPSTVALVSHKDMQAAIRGCPSLVPHLWRATLVDAGTFRAWMLGLGRHFALAHMAHLFCELFVRLRAVGLVSGSRCLLPLTQPILGDALGISLVHVNRTLQELRARRLIEFDRRELTILDWDQLARIAQFDPTYLQLRPPG